MLERAIGYVNPSLFTSHVHQRPQVYMISLVSSDFWLPPVMSNSDTYSLILFIV